MIKAWHIWILAVMIWVGLVIFCCIMIAASIYEAGGLFTTIESYQTNKTITVQDRIDRSSGIGYCNGFCIVLTTDNETYEAHHSTDCIRLKKGKTINVTLIDLSQWISKSCSGKSIYTVNP